MEFNYIIKSFSELSVDELYKILKLRQDVFIVEQLCPFPDIDDLDSLCDHLWVEKEGSILGYTRISGPNTLLKRMSVGRIIVSEKARKTGLGTYIIQESLSILDAKYPGQECEISAQGYLKKYYSKFGFKPIGDDYILDGIPHVKMIRPAQPSS